jgi:predicted transcriptional regulator
MTIPMTTIKVPTALRDRLTTIAKRDNTTLAGAIEQSLEVAEEVAFWNDVRATMPVHTTGMDDYDGTLADGLELEDWSDL